MSGRGEWRTPEPFTSEIETIMLRQITEGKDPRKTGLSVALSQSPILGIGVHRLPRVHRLVIRPRCVKNEV